ncbi:HNH endonuclease signature motif containing protein [Microbacterium sp. H1-D42]|uniref:HNH endonuclease signature motif containing protein n=1 Tax=Microbacterium sp. H1-D42 TaxID=2925844 RepID=UPI001F52E158|nr:HNH endonuclease signature motif containing protein [Microbacterium sp. H1-D42]UNK69784.1 HNH endonuclease [Microbacterium sp. H1-D42]
MRGTHQFVGAGLIATRSTRVAGQDGLAQTRGHRTPAALVQQITGVGYAEAQRHVRLGLAILETDAARGSTRDDGSDSQRPHDHDPGCNGTGSPGSNDAADHDDSGAGRPGSDGSDGDKPAGDESEAGDAGTGAADGGEHSGRRIPWHAPLSTALMQGRISPAQQDAIQRGLGQPIEDSDDTHAAWTAAAEQLLADAAERTVEELRIQARAIRDQLDPEGAARRFAERYERRSFRTWIDADGRERGHIEFEDEGAAWMRAIRDAALRPRRGGPRFVGSDEVREARDLAADSRTNDQLFYDLLIDLLHAGALADAKDVFGTRQAGVRLVQVQGADGVPTSARTEDYGMPVPFASVQQRMCESGAARVTIDSSGNPLDVGREHRLFTPRQRIALAIRDGGCRWRGCDRPASYCEAHHIDEWHAEGGRTDVARGILLCRHHHMQLHHNSWRITRDGTDDFLLHPPGGKPPICLRPRTALVAAWAGIDPPPKRFRPVA